MSPLNHRFRPTKVNGKHSTVNPDTPPQTPRTPSTRSRSTSPAADAEASHGRSAPDTSTTACTSRRSAAGPHLLQRNAAGGQGVQYLLVDNHHKIAAFVLLPTYVTKNLGASIGKMAISRAYSPSLRKKVMLFSTSFGYFERYELSLLWPKFPASRTTRQRRFARQSSSYFVLLLLASAIQTSLIDFCW